MCLIDHALKAPQIEQQLAQTSSAAGLTDFLRLRVSETKVLQFDIKNQAKTKFLPASLAESSQICNKSII